LKQEIARGKPRPQGRSEFTGIESCERAMGSRSTVVLEDLPKNMYERNG